MKNQLKDVKTIMMVAIYNISAQFVDDFIHIVEVTRGDVNEYLFDGLVSEIWFNSKINGKN